MRGLPWKGSSVQADGLGTRTSSLFLIVSILFYIEKIRRARHRAQEVAQVWNT